MKIIGLTGGIASGKSTVAAVLRSLGAKIFDADAASRQAVARGSQGLQQVIDVFGRDYLTIDGELDRQKIAQLRGHQADHNVKDPVRRHRRQDLTVHQLGNSLHGHPECIIGLAQQNKQHRI